MDDITPDHKIDITKDVCPMTFVRTRLKLETMTQGQVLEVTLGAGEPLKTFRVLSPKWATPSLTLSNLPTHRTHTV